MTEASLLAGKLTPAQRGFPFGRLAEALTGLLAAGDYELLTSGEHGPYLEKRLLRRAEDGSALWLHRFHRSDADDELHDHPWDNHTLVLSGGYWDVTLDGRRWLGPGAHTERKAADFHRVELEPGVFPVTLFLTGPKVNAWGFRLADGRKVPWREFTANSGAYRTASARSRASQEGSR